MGNRFFDMYNSDSQLAQILISFSLGIILSPISGSLLLVIAFMLPWDLYLCKTKKDYNYLHRFTVILAYVAGWLLGKSVHWIQIIVTSKKMDKKHMKTPLYENRHYDFESDESSESEDLDDIIFKIKK